MTTVTLDCPVPPVPLQPRLNVVVAVKAPVPCVPAVDLLPLQPPEAVHDVALVLDQVSVLLPPLLTEVGDADNVTVGAGVEAVTVTEALACAVPPAPVQLNVNAASALNAPVLSLPETALLPLHPPDAVHDVALVDDQVNVLLDPLLTEVGAADKLTVGAAGGGLPPEESPPPPPQATRTAVITSGAILIRGLMAAMIGNRR